MGSRGSRTEPAPVVLAASDAYLARLGRETLRLEVLVDETILQIQKRRNLINAGLISRNLTRLDFDGVQLRRHGRGELHIA